MAEQTRHNPFPHHWPWTFSTEELERLAIMTIDGGLSDKEAEAAVLKQRRENEPGQRELF
jgi:hypothetical protein